MTTEHKLSQDLRGLLGGDQDLTIGSIFQAMGDRGFGLVLVVLALPSALPVPAAGYSTPFGLMLALLALQMISGRHRPWLPERAAKLKLNRNLAGKMINAAVAFLKRLEWLIKPRWSWASGRVGHTFAGVIVLVMAGLMILPIPGTNTAPAAVIFLTGIALTEEDGLMLGFTTLLGIGAILFYAFVLSVVFYYGASGVSEGLNLIKGWF